MVLVQGGAFGHCNHHMVIQRDTEFLCLHRRSILHASLNINIVSLHMWHPTILKVVKCQNYNCWIFERVDECFVCFLGCLEMCMSCSVLCAITLFVFVCLVLCCVPLHICAFVCLILCCVPLHYLALCVLFCVVCHYIICAFVCLILCCVQLHYLALCVLFCVVCHYINSLLCVLFCVVFHYIVCAFVCLILCCVPLHYLCLCVSYFVLCSITLFVITCGGKKHTEMSFWDCISWNWIVQTFPIFCVFIWEGKKKCYKYSWSGSVYIHVSCSRFNSNCCICSNDNVYVMYDSLP